MPQISPMLGKCDGLVGSKSICSVLERKTTGCRGSPTATQGLPLGVGEGASELDSPPRSPRPRPGQVHFCAQTPRKAPSLRLLTRRCNVLRSSTEAGSSLG